MGNDPFKYIHYNINENHENRVLDSDKKKTLFTIFKQFSQKKDYLTKENFNNIIRLDDEKILNKIFDIFASYKEKMYYTDLKSFYIAFRNPQIKYILLSFLLFGKKENIDISTYINNLSDFVKIDETFLSLQDEEFITKISYKIINDNGFLYRYVNHKTKEELNINKQRFIGYLTKDFLKNIFYISFVKEILPSSKVDKIMRNKRNLYICDCLKDNSILINGDLLDKIEPHFLVDKLVIDKHLTFDNFGKMMDEYDVHKKLIELITKYLNAYTMKESINFNDFKKIMSYVYDIKDNKKKRDFLLEIILTIFHRKNSIKASQLKEIFQIENKECKLEGIIKANSFDKIEDSIINAKINEYIGYMDNLGLLPYIRYNLDTEDEELKKKIIKFILNGKTIEKYLEENFDKCNKFYPVNIDFWNVLIDNEVGSGNKEKSELKINNLLIAERDEIYYIEKKKDENNKDKGFEKGKEKIYHKKQDNTENNIKNLEKKQKNETKENNSINKEKKETEKETDETNGKNLLKEKDEIKEKSEKKVCIKGKLKNGVQYTKDYVILCDDIYEKISRYFEFDCLVELEKTIIYNEPKKEEEKKLELEKNVEIKEKEKLEIKEKKDKNGIKEVKNEIKEEKDEKIEIKQEIKEDKNEIKKETLETKEIKNEIIEIKQEIKEDKNEIKKETSEIKNDRNGIKEDNNELKEEKLEINYESSFMRKKENKNKNINEYIVDFNPIKILQLPFNDLLNIIQQKFDDEEKKRKKKEFKNKTKKEQDRITYEERKMNRERERRIKEYKQKRERIEDLLKQKILTNQKANEQYIILNEKYKDLEVDANRKKVTKSKFFEILKEEFNNIVFDKLKYMNKIYKLITTQEIKYQLINNKANLDLNNFDIFYYTIDKKLLNPQGNEILKDVDNDFILIVTDQKNEQGKTGLSILEENEKSQDKKDDIKNLETNQDLISDEEIKILKDEQAAKEKAKREKERLEKEKLEKAERERRKAQEKITHPPYGIPNFGNTCYFNSVNQMFLNLTIMQQLFSEKNIKYMINKENKFGFKGKLVSSFLPLYELYPYQIEDYVRSLKSLVGKLKDTFNNREQQDAHEYLNFILEGLHEDLNIKSSKIYIEDNDDNYKTNTEEELGNLAWANNLRRNASFIDSIFMFQLKSNLTCRKCQKTKVNFESSYVFDLPLSLCKLVTVNINLFRLPFKYKIYYDKISEKFKKFKENEEKEEKDKKITEILCDYYSKELSFQEKKDQAIYVSFEFDIEREKCIDDMIKQMRNISLLELEPENIENSIDDKDIKENKINHYTDFIIYSYDLKKLFKNDMIIDKFVDVNDRVYLNVYEVLNTNGFRIVNKNYLEKTELNLYSYKINKKGITSLEGFKRKIKDSNYFNKKFEDFIDNNEIKESTKTKTNNNKKSKAANKQNETKQNGQTKGTNELKKSNDTKKLDEIKEVNQIKDAKEQKESDVAIITNKSNDTKQIKETKETNKAKNPNEIIGNKELEKSNETNESVEGEKNDDFKEQNNTKGLNEEIELNKALIIKKDLKNEEKEDNDIKEFEDFVVIPNKIKESKEKKELNQVGENIIIKENNIQNEKKINKISNNSIQAHNDEYNEEKINILSINDKISYIDNYEDDIQNKSQKNFIICEYQIPIVHYRRDLAEIWQFIFQEFTHLRMQEFPMQLLILNNNPSNKLSSRDLYNYIWDYNSLYMIHPNKSVDDLWFNKDKEEKNYKKCYPFIIRLVKQNKKFDLPYKCAKCHWYNFCIGCVLSPDEEKLEIEPGTIIFVDWCNSLIKEEIESKNFYFKKFSNEDIKLCIESSVRNDKNNQYQSIDDCFNLFFEKENLEDPLSCRVCGGPQNFTKYYEINKLPYVLILSLKRFKYNENNNFKLRQLITYPLNNFKLKDKNYNLFGVVYHYGGINSGHYTCAIRKDNKWKLCDDSRVSDLEEKRVMTSNAYILFYIADDSINDYSYYNCMQSLLQHIIIDKLRRTHTFKDNNFFKGEPIREKTKGIGYVSEDYIEDFIIEEKNKEKGDKVINKENEIKINEEKKEDEEINKNINSNKNGKIKVKFESIKNVEIIDKNNIEKLILIDEQKKAN